MYGKDMFDHEDFPRHMKHRLYPDDHPWRGDTYTDKGLNARDIRIQKLEDKIDGLAKRLDSLIEVIGYLNKPKIGDTDLRPYFQKKELADLPPGW